VQTHKTEQGTIQPSDNLATSKRDSNENNLNLQREKKNMAKLTTATRDRITAEKFAFPKQRKEPLENASHVRNAAARFNQVKGVTEAERRAAWKRIQSAAKRFGVELKEVA
jgi:hypothetical protein